MEGTFEKTGLSALFAMVALHFEGASVLVWLFVIFSLIDYISGITAALKNHGLIRDKAYWGAIKKIAGFTAVAVACGVDIMIGQVLHKTGMDVPLAPFGILALCYMITAEGISILENLFELGIAIPLLSKAIKTVRDKLDASVK